MTLLTSSRLFTAGPGTATTLYMFPSIIHPAYVFNSDQEQEAARCANHCRIGFKLATPGINCYL
ncbi:hypothetical protein HCH_05287 [Hahella chejuensis KCTC 2396]|uniref:Uncharacterized protein n=1 Tax=Hahella chejuensis (strain KCTC 2396) TaxID=349521 RepID=Q2SBL3_HAHCH|nr:hypothetical protein HCH_05287 [Hahella chejuensis KCTC 2396]